MKKVICVCVSIVLFSTYLIIPSSAQYIDEKGEWKFKDTVVLNGTIYAVEKCEKTLFGRCTVGTYQAVPASVLIP